MNASQTHQQVSIAVIGAGYWGNNLIRNAQACEHTHLARVCDADLQRARRTTSPYADVALTASLDEVLSDPSIEAVAIATPAASHHPIAMAALAAGKHVLVEKPLASTFAEGQEMVAEAERRGLILMVDHTFCYTPAVQRIRELVHNGDLGDILFFDSVRINLGLVQPDVDVLWDLAPHDLSILDFVLPGEMRALAVSAQGADPIGAGKACVAYLTLTLPQNSIAHAHVNWLSPTKVRTTVIGGSKRTLVWDDLNPTQRISIFDRGVDLVVNPEQVGREERAAAMVSYRSGDMIAPALPEREALRDMMTELASAIRQERPAATDGRAGLRVLDLLDSASRSMAFHGATVPLRGIR